jgi:hypothetical protein
MRLHARGPARRSRRRTRLANEHPYEQDRCREQYHELSKTRVFVRQPPGECHNENSRLKGPVKAGQQQMSSHDAQRNLKNHGWTSVRYASDPGARRAGLRLPRFRLAWQRQPGPPRASFATIVRHVRCQFKISRRIRYNPVPGDRPACRGNSVIAVGDRSISMRAYERGRNGWVRSKLAAWTINPVVPERNKSALRRVAHFASTAVAPAGAVAPRLQAFTRLRRYSTGPSLSSWITGAEMVCDPAYRQAE